MIESPVGRHVENVFYLKDSRDMASLWDVIRHFISQGRIFQLFLFLVFEEKSPYRVGRHVLINLKLIDMAFGYDVRWFIIESPVGRHVLNVRPKKGINLSTER